MDESGVTMRDFADTLALYDVRTLHAENVMAAAASLLAAGMDGRALAALASVHTPVTGIWERDELVAAARAELGLPELDANAAQVRAAQAQARRWVVGDLTNRELMRWAHELVGHEGASELSDLVEAQDLVGGSYPRPLPEGDLRVHLGPLCAEIIALPDPWAFTA